MKLEVAEQTAEQASGLGESSPVDAVSTGDVKEFAGAAGKHPAAEDAEGLVATVAELRDQVRLLSHLVASLLPPPEKGPVGSKKAGDWAQEAREAAGADPYDPTDPSDPSDEAEAAGLEGLQDATKTNLTSAKEQGAGSREQGAGSREQGSKPNLRARGACRRAAPDNG